MSASPVHDRASALVNTGAKLFEENQLEPARLHFLAALALNPDHVTALQNLGAVLRNLGHYAAAEVVARRSVMLTQWENAFCLSNLGVSLLGLRRYGEAAKILESVTKMLPDSSPSWHNYGLILYMTGQYNRALAAFDKSLALGYTPNCASDRGLTLLSLERISDGLAAYECRWDVLHRNRIWDMNIPEWKGEDLAGQHILVHHEQGFGDSIMLIRFLKQLAQRNCRITLAVPPALVRLFKWNFPFVTTLALDDEKINADAGFDYHSPLLSVMRWVGIKSPKDISSAPYLAAKGETKFELPSAKTRIGICWASGNHAPSMVDRRRIVPLTLFLPLLREQGIGLVSLQKGEDSKEILAHGLEGLVFDVSHRLEDFAATADVIQCLDLVISVDSAVAHLAGAMGKPCLMLSPYTRCWRWWSLPKGSPWYDRMLVYTQAQDGTWGEAMEKAIARALWVVRDMR